VYDNDIQQREARLPSRDQEESVPITGAGGDMQENERKIDSRDAGIQTDVGGAFAANRNDPVVYEPGSGYAGVRGGSPDMDPNERSKGLSARMLEVKALERALRKAQVCMCVYACTCVCMLEVKA
jgi:hypothetical protein